MDDEEGYRLSVRASVNQNFTPILILKPLVKYPKIS